MTACSSALGALRLTGMACRHSAARRCISSLHQHVDARHEDEPACPLLVLVGRSGFCRHGTNQTLRAAVGASHMRNGGVAYGRLTTSASVAGLRQARASPNAGPRSGPAGRSFHRRQAGTVAAKCQDWPPRRARRAPPAPWTAKLSLSANQNPHGVSRLVKSSFAERCV